MNSFITENIESQADNNSLTSFRKIYHIRRKSNLIIWLWGALILLVIIMLLPWTQNIRAKGTITTLRQEQRPQELNAIIGGRVIKWHAKEGDFVKKGDTILQLGEVKVDYFDPQLLERTQEQINAKRQSIEEYKRKANTTTVQAQALERARELKLQSLENKIAQQQLKVKTDEAELLALNNELSVYKRQIDAAKMMLDSGALSLSEFEKRKINHQNTIAKINGTNNKLLQDRQELVSLGIDQSTATQDYADKIAKAKGEGFASLSGAAGTEAEVLKLQNQYSNYDARSKLFYITAPQSGQLIKAKKAGIGEIVKEGETMAEIVPDQIQYAVEMFVEPKDLPLVSTGQKVRFVFDGFPAIIFSGWPENSHGTFSGRVSAVESSVSYNGKFRVLVTEDPNDKQWPKQLRIGGGASGIALLNDVPIYYELWRNINGFPPEYYKTDIAGENINEKAK